MKHLQQKKKAAEKKANEVKVIPKAPPIKRSEPAQKLSIRETGLPESAYENSAEELFSAQYPETFDYSNPLIAIANNEDMGLCGSFFNFIFLKGKPNLTL